MGHVNIDFIVKQAADDLFICVNSYNATISDTGFGDGFLCFAIRDADSDCIVLDGNFTAFNL